jgi:hypothetical protein
MDQSILSILIGTMNEEIIGQMDGCYTSTAIWGCLNTMFSA